MTPQQFSEYLDKEIAVETPDQSTRSGTYAAGRRDAANIIKLFYDSIEQPDPWISASFALPSIDGRESLVKIKYKDGTEDLGYRYNGSWRNCHGYYDHPHNSVTHWMHLPSAPSPVNKPS
jgi:hypothetical protein